jgi:hypothetical protein
MKTKEILSIGVFVIAVCVISLIPFSNNLSYYNFNSNHSYAEYFIEGNDPENSPTPSLTSTPSPSLTSTPSPSLTSTPSPSLTSTPSPSLKSTPSPSLKSTPSPSLTPMPSLNPTDPNPDVINAIIKATSNPPDYHNDKIAIYNIQSLISKLRTQNAATLLGEIANPNNLTDPRLFLNYINWFASHCPLDSNTCTGLC